MIYSNPIILPNNLRALRENRSIEVKEIAALLGCHPSYVISVELMTANLSGINTVRLLTSLDITFNKLFDIKGKYKGYNINLTNNIDWSIENKLRSMSFGKKTHKIKQLQQLHGKSNNEMAAILGVKPITYSQMTGDQRISTIVMWRIVYHLRVPLESVINIKEYKRKYDAEA